LKHSGARIGEASAINDRTLDFGRGTVDLSETIVWIKGRPYHVKGTKTNNPNKKVITPLIREMLLELKNERRPVPNSFFITKEKCCAIR